MVSQLPGASGAGIQATYSILSEVNHYVALFNVDVSHIIIYGDQM